MGSEKTFFQKKYLLFLVLLLTLLKGFLWIELIPLLQTPDAERHFSTVMWYAEPKEKNWEITQNSKSTDSLDIKTYNIPPEYYNFLEKYEFEETRFNPNNHQSFSENSNVGPNEEKINNNDLFKNFNALPATIVNYPKPYYVMGSWIYNLFREKSIIVRILAVEAYTFLISLGTILFAFKVARLLSFSKRESALFAGILSFQPMFSFMSISVNPDSLLFFGFAVFFYFALRTIIKFEPLPVLGLFLGSIIAVFSKPTGFATIPLLFLAIYMGLVRKYHWSKRIIGFIFGGSIISFLIATGLILKFKTELGLVQIFSTSSKFGSYFGELLTYLKIHFSFEQQYKIFDSYWGCFGWLDYSLPTTTYIMIFFVILISCIGLLPYFSKEDNQQQKGEHLFLLFSVIVFHIAILMNEFAYFKDSTILYGTQGRYFIPTIVPSLLLIILGLGKITENILTREQLLKILFILMIMLNIYSLTAIILPAYYL